MEKDILDLVDEGIIAVQKTGSICIFNRKAKEIFGIDSSANMDYPSGKLEDGDVLVIAITSLGQDDGQLTPSLLKKINLEEKLSKGAAVLIIGEFGGPHPAQVKTSEGQGLGTKLEMTHIYKGRRIASQIDLHERTIDIIIDGQNYPVEFIQSFGHMVVLCGKTGAVKFVQSKGYSFRKESIGDLLRGASFKGQCKNESTDLLGRAIDEVLNEPLLTEQLSQTAKGFSRGFKNKYLNIHGRPVLCSLQRMENTQSGDKALLKVEDVSEFDMLIRERNEALKELQVFRNRLLLEKELDPFPQIIGSSHEMKQVKRLAKSASASQSTVLILGESGTGKNVIAKAIHEKSSIRNKPFIQVNCGALPEHLIESELFGYASGAFSGASSKGKPGFFELANGGTLFLDEVGEIPLNVQVKLLHAIQHNQFYRVGGTKAIDVDIRIIAATNKVLEKEVMAGRFREDLYYRLNVLRIKLPPLRDRSQDIPDLIKALLPSVCSRLGKPLVKISKAAEIKLTDYLYPGNVRELENLLERALNIAEGTTEKNEIEKDHVIFDALSQAYGLTPKWNEEEDQDKMEAVTHSKPLKTLMQEFEKAEIEKALKENKGNKDMARKSLGIGKSSFYEKIKKYKIAL